MSTHLDEDGFDGGAVFLSGGELVILKQSCLDNVHHVFVKLLLQTTQ
jgi:hypothetical protein